MSLKNTLKMVVGFGLLLVLLGAPTEQASSSTYGWGTFNKPVAFVDNNSVDLHWDHPYNYDTYVLKRDGQVLLANAAALDFYRDTSVAPNQAYTYQMEVYDGDTYKFSGAAQTVTTGQIGGDLYQNKTWTGGDYWLAEHIEIMPGATLKIQSDAAVKPAWDEGISDAGGCLQITDSEVWANVLIKQACSVLARNIFIDNIVYFEYEGEFTDANLFKEGARLHLGYHQDSWVDVRNQQFKSDAEIWVEGVGVSTIADCALEEAQIEVFNGGTVSIGHSEFRQGGETAKSQPSIWVRSDAGSVDILENQFEDAGIRVEGAFRDVIIRDNNMVGNGNQVYTAIEVQGGEPEIYGNQISYYGAGLQFGSYSPDGGEATRNMIVFNGDGIVIDNAAQPVVNNNCIAENWWSGAEAGTGVTQAVDLTGNWWGTSSGPYNADTNPDGKGNRVVGATLDYSGWLTAGNCPVAELEITDATAVQVVEDPNWWDVLPVAAGRGTVVRAYGQAAISDIAGVEGELRAYRAGDYLGKIDSENSIWIEPGADPDDQIQDLENGAVLFVLPEAWTTPGNLTYSVTLNPDGSPEELRSDNNTITGTITFKDQDPFRIAYVPLKYAPGEGEGVPPGMGNILRGHTFLQKILPHAQVEMGLFPAMSWDKPMRAAADRFTEWKNGSELLNNLSVQLILWNLTHPPEERFNQIVGVFPGGPEDMISNGLADIRWGLDDDPNMGLGLASYCWATGDCFAHQIGHNLGLHHTNVAGKPCYAPDDFSKWDNYYVDNSIAAFGYDFRYDKQVPGATPDIMSWCANTWVSAMHWESLMSANGVPQPPFDGETAVTSETAEAATAAETEYLLVRGWTSFEGVTELLPFWTTPASSLPVWTPNNGTDYCVRMKDASGAVLVEHCMDAQFYDHEINEWAIEKYFIAALPLPAGSAAQGADNLLAGVAEISIFSDKFDTTVATRQPSAHVPEVQVTAPAGGASLNADTEIRWTGSDADGDPLVYAIFYQPTASAPWSPLVMDLEETTYLAHLADLPAGSDARFKVVASDGYHMGSGLSGKVTVPDRTMVVNILAPVAASSYQTEVFLSGYGYHPDNGLLSDTALTWSSNRDGELGVGAEFTATLSVGAHVLTLTADDGSEQAHATVNITVSDAPVVIAGLKIQGPASATSGQVVTLEASLTQGTDVVYTWDFKDGTTATGKTVNHIFPLYENTYHVKLTAENSVSQRTAYLDIAISNPVEAIAGLKITGPASAGIGEAVTLKASVDQGTDVVYTWDFKDGTTATGQTVVHTFPLYASTYQVKLTAENSVSLQTALHAIVIGSDSPNLERVFLPIVHRAR